MRRERKYFTIIAKVYCGGALATQTRKQLENIAARMRLCFDILQNVDVNPAN